MINNILHRVRRRIYHFFHSGYWRGHHVHSPFVYHLVRHVVTTRTIDKKLRNKARQYRKELLHSKINIDVTDFGTGASQQRPVCEIARRAAVCEKYGLLLARIIAEYQPETIIEVGTSLGISTFYLSQATNKTIDTIEGCPKTAAQAQENLSKFGVSNVRYHIGNFDDILPSIVAQASSPIVAFIDGNHTYDATLRYFEMLAQKFDNELLIIIFDDVHWSKGMSDAWRTIVADKRVMNTIDIFQMGIVIFRIGCQKENFLLRW